jgi:hypothetical protein
MDKKASMFMKGLRIKTNKSSYWSPHNYHVPTLKIELKMDNHGAYNSKVL